MLHPEVLDDALSKAQTIWSQPHPDSYLVESIGGADRDRTDDILLAKQALSQLSYSPIRTNLIRVSPSRRLVKRMVGLGRFELPTSPLSGVRSSQLSYRPRSEICTRQLIATECNP
jgi:hypothetical protein